MKSFLFMLCTLIAHCAVAQRSVYDIVDYMAPAGWKSENADSYISYSKIDGSSWAQLTIYKSTTSKGDTYSDMDSEWKAIVESLHAVSKVENTPPKNADGWTVISRSAIWQYNGANVASILTVYTNHVVCVSVLCNATAMPYFENYKTLISSISFNAKTNVPAQPPTTTANNTSSHTSLIGLWGIYINETSGIVNGTPWLTGGYFRKEYTFFENGTYQFLEKDLSASSTTTILFGWETGTWKVEGNKLTITPKKGQEEQWSKPANGRTDQWGNRVKTSPRKLETITYDSEMKYYSGQNETHLLLRFGQPTHREGKSNNMDNHLHEWSYTPQPVSKAMVTPPPGTVISF